jgi:hypothetical protein
MEACQLVFNDCFDLLFQILLLILLSFDLLMLQWWLSAWCGGVHGGRLCLGYRLFWWLSWSPNVYSCWIMLHGCLWLGRCFEYLTSSCLGRAFSRMSLRWHFAGVLSNSQTVGANVGVRLLETIELR